MEKALDEVMDEALAKPNVVGCLFGDQQGLCLGSKGNVSAASTGIIVALSELSCRIQPNEKPPIIHLENDNRQCIIQKQGFITTAIFKRS